MDSFACPATIELLQGQEPDTPLPILHREVEGTVVKHRKARPGPELRLIRRFLDTFPIKTPAYHQVTIFIEPLVATTYPDLLICLWDTRKKPLCTEGRRAFSMADIRVWFAIISMGTADDHFLERLFGSAFRKSVRILTEAGVIRKNKFGYIALRLESQVVLRNLIAIEGKVADVQKAVDQAVLNSWFASDSVALLPNAPKKLDTNHLAALTGVRVISCEMGALSFPRHHPRTVLRSFMTLYFNELILRTCFHGEGI